MATGLIQICPPPRSALVVQGGQITNLEVWRVVNHKLVMPLEVRRNGLEFLVYARDRRPPHRHGPLAQAAQGLSHQLIDKLEKIFGLHNVSKDSEDPLLRGFKIVCF